VAQWTVELAEMESVLCDEARAFKSFVANYVDKKEKDDNEGEKK
jgi:hypothetical protein